MRSVEGDGSVRDEVICYLNRISDWLFVMGRWIAKNTGEEEVLWTPLGKRDRVIDFVRWTLGDAGQSGVAPSLARM